MDRRSRCEIPVACRGLLVGLVGLGLCSAAAYGLDHTAAVPVPAERIGAAEWFGEMRSLPESRDLLAKRAARSDSSRFIEVACRIRFPIIDPRTGTSFTPKLQLQAASPGERAVTRTPALTRDARFFTILKKGVRYQLGWVYPAGTVVPWGSLAVDARPGEPHGYEVEYWPPGSDPELTKAIQARRAKAAAQAADDAAAAARSGATTLPIEVVDASEYGGDDDEPGEFLIRSESELLAVWHRAHGRQSPPRPPPRVDFERHALIAVFMGTQSSGGYSIAVKRVTLSKDGTELTVDVEETTTDPALPVTDALTSPYQLVRIPAGKYRMKVRRTQF